MKTIYLDMDIKKLIKEAVESIVMNEGTITFFQIGPNIGMVVTKHTTEQVWLDLFDFATKKCVGVITLRKISERAWGITTVAADNGYGPIMYELAMMYIHPHGVCTDRLSDTKDAAMNVCKKFVNDRIDVKKIQIKEDDIEYMTKNSENEEKFELQNIICAKKPSIWLGKLIKRGEDLIKSSGISTHEIEGLCRDYFMHRYKNG